MDQKRNSTLDLLKLLASYMVVFIHVLFYGDFGAYVDALGRFAVPLFFLTSGYFAYRAPLHKIKMRTLYIFRLLIVASVTYTLYNIVHFLLSSDIESLMQYLGCYLDVGTWIKLIVYNVPISNSMVWYLLALMYVYVIFCAVSKFQISDNLIITSGLFLLFLHVILAEGLLAFGIKIPVYYLRNFLMMGISFFATGLLVKKHEAQIATTSNILVYIFLVVGIVATLFSRIFFGKNELYIGSLFILCGFIILFVKYPNNKYPGWITALLGCSTYIYIFHRVISYCVIDFYGWLGIDYYSSIALQMIHPVFICIVSTLLAYGINEVLQRHRSIENKIGRDLKDE